jgi:Tetratricopeptide repeat
VECPKCGRTVDDGAFICPACEFILDTSFLGDDITDDERAIRKRNEQASKQARAEKGEKRVDFGEDAMILGSVDEQEFSDFRSRDAGVSQREVTQARFYVGGIAAQLLNPDAVPEVVPGAFSGSIRMTPFERHVLEFINGKRSIGRIQKKSGMEESEFKTSVAMLGDKGIIRLRTMKKKKKGGSLLQGSVSEHRAVAEGFVAGDRTVVAPAPEPPAEHVDANAGGAFADDESATELALPARDERAARSVDGGTAARSVDNERFRSLRADSAVESVESDAKAGDAWGGGGAPMNSSNVFARAKAGKKKSNAKEPSLVDRDPDAARAGGFSEERSGLSESVRARLQPPPGEVQRMPEPPSLLPGVPPEDDDDLLFAPGSAEGAHEASREDTPAPAELDDNDAEQDEGKEDKEDKEDDEDDEDEEFDGPTGPRRPLATSNTMTHVRSPARQEDALPDRGRVYDEHTQARDLTSAPTGPLPPSAEVADDAPPSARDGADAAASHRADADEGDEREGDDEAEGFDVDLQTAAARSASRQRTASVPQSLPELPSDALVALPSERSRSSASALPSAPALVVSPLSALPAPAPPPLPGQSLVRSPAVAAAPPPRPATTSQPAGGRPSTAVKPAMPIGAGRPSAQSTVPFEQARKAEKIFEQAQKDHAAGRLSSARMNAKLATQFDGSVPAYKELLAMLDEAAAGQKPATVKPREVQLFEQASEAEGRGDYRKAVQFLKQALEINNKAAQLYNRLGVVLSIRLKEHDEALGYLKRAIELEPGSLVYMNNFSKVTAALESQLERDPEEKKKNSRMDRDNKVDIKKMRPKMF